MQAGAPAAGSGGTAAPSAGGFPRTSEEINLKATGPYTVMTYTEGLKVSEYSSAVMYYPADAPPPFAAVALAPGYTASGTDYEFVGDMLASHGIAALLTTPTDTNADQPPARGDDLVAAVKHLMEESSRQGSPLQGTSGVPQGTPAKANANYDPQAAYMVPFYKLFLESDERYRPYLYGSMRSMMSVTRFESSKKQ
jgi:hypothetical protein